MEERRAGQRARVSRDANIILGHASAFISCTLHDLTNSGACLSFTGAVVLPETFELTFDHGRSCRPCRLRWRIDNKLGVAFEKSHGLKG
jgi:PilZ domain-containing protein